MDRAMKLRTLLVLVSLLLACAASLVGAKDSGPVAAVTGAFAVGGKPAERTCNQLGCHNDLSQNLPGATLQILDAPAAYRPDSLYTIRVRMTSTWPPAGTGRRWGFQFTSVNATTGDSAGSYQPLNTTTQLAAGIGGFTTRRYIHHTTAGTYQGNNGPVEWSFRWKAPSSNVGRVYLFAAGNAADNSETNNGDHIYTTRDTVEFDATVSAPPTVPAGVALAAMPNPAPGGTRMRFLLADAADVALDVLDVQGRAVRALAAGRREAGSHTIAWDGRDAAGAAAPAGLYFVRLASPGLAPRTIRVVLER